MRTFTLTITSDHPEIEDMVQAAAEKLVQDTGGYSTLVDVVES